MSVALVLEYESAMLRHIADSRLDERAVGDLIDYICDVGMGQEVFFLWRPVLRDANDDMVLEVAVAAACDTIVTHNVRDFQGAEKFGIRVTTPGAFLQELRG